MTDIHEDKSPFWAVQLGGWSLFLLVMLAANFYDEQLGTRTLLLAFAIVFFGFLFTTLLRFHIRKRQWLKKGPRRQILPVLWGSLISGTAWTACFIGFHYLIGNDNGEPVHYTLIQIGLSLLNNYFITLLWSLIYMAYHYFRIAQLSRVERYKSEAAIRDAQLNTLKGQINPHFMFNSLNNIRALMLEDVTRSREMLTKLSDLLRYSMTISEKKEVPLKDELEVVHDFLELCKVQYEERLKYSIEANDALSMVRIPPMIIQILAENSVKHGIANRLEGGHVGVVVAEKDEYLSIQVSNSGTWNQNPKKGESHGIGLPNIRKRLKIMYGDKANMHLREENESVIAEIKIPL